MDRAPPNLNPKPSQSPSAGLATSRTNRLRRSCRAQSQQPKSPATQPPEAFETAHLRHKDVRSQPPPAFKTPTRMTRSKYATVPCAESPNSDVEFHQDIVWDANSPSPVRAGRRGKSRAASAPIGISEIVRRIAPMHGRPVVVEPTLQEWIGESAAIPCTPEVHHPKKKSPRSSCIDDLLKLAKQFDFNMFQQDEEQAEDMHQQTLELLSEDILEYESGFQDGPQVPPAEPPPPVTETAPEVAPDVVGGPQDHHMEDDLELLFDEPTQRISGSLSQVGLPGSTDTSCCTSSGAAGDAPPGPPPPLSTRWKDGPAGYQLDDDWDNDDFLDDASFLEMTQNPQGFAPPRYCSTQSGSDGALRGGKPPSRGTPGQLGGCGVVPECGPRMTKNRTTFGLDANPLSLRAIGAAGGQGSNGNFSVPQSEALSRMPNPIAGCHLTRPSQPAGDAVFKSPAGPPPKIPLAKSGAKPNSAVATAATANAMKENRPTRSPNIRQTAVADPSNGLSWRPPPAPVAPASDDPLDQSLDELFSSETAWGDEGEDDDGNDDDDLLCQMCDELETQAEVPERPAPPTAPTRGTGNDRKVPDSSDVSRRCWTGALPAPAAGRLCSPAARPKPSPLCEQQRRPGGNSTRVESFKQGPPDYGHSNGASKVGSVQCHGGGPSLKATAGDKGQFSFKKPPSPSVTVVNTGPEKCSMADIERKRRLAMERRQQRLQATQKLGAPR